MPKATQAMSVSDLEKRISALENYFRVGLILAVILGVSGGWLGKVVYDTQSIAAEAKKVAEEAEQRLQQATADAVATVKTTAKSAVIAEASTQVGSRFAELASKLTITFGTEGGVDYQKIGAGNSFDSKCQEGSAMTGWGYGHKNNDVRIFCRPISAGH